ncbi:MAG: alpha/beta fold hydrolase, partial [Candidatus Helarchaeota archaeon]|nr:alpha/beta fold hydrolase [Candidatus Helarchaeota archaeon]
NSDWYPPEFIDDFSKKFKTIIFDNRGGGRTDKPEIEYSIKLLADDTVGLMDALQIQKAHLYGGSMGGMIAQELVLNYPERVEKLVIASSTCGFGRYVLPYTKVLELQDELQQITDGRERIKLLTPLCFTEEFKQKRPEVIEQLIQRAMKQPMGKDTFMNLSRAILKWDACRRLKTITNPTMVIHGAKDVMIPVNNAEIIAKKIPGVKKVILENSGHSLLEEYEKMVHAVIEFLEG